MSSKPEMMRTKILKIAKKRFFFKEYLQLLQLERAVKIIKKNEPSNLQISILGKFIQEYSNDQKESVNESITLEVYCKGLLGSSTDFGIFSNPEMGTIFIVGSLTSMFLHEVEEKALATMSTGPYGILRGLGASQLQTETYLKALNNGSYLLIVRGNDNKLKILEDIL